MYCDEFFSRIKQYIYLRNFPLTQIIDTLVFV